MNQLSRNITPEWRTWTNRFGQVVCLSLIFAAYAAAQTVSIDKQALDAGADIILLKNGQSVVGSAQVSVERTIVTTASGSEIFLRTSDVLTVCQTWQQAWEFQRDSVDVSNPEKLVELMRWCVRNRLFPEAWQVIDQLQHSGMSATDLYSLHRQVTSAEKSWEMAQRPVAPEADLIEQPAIIEPEAPVMVAEMQEPTSGENSTQQVIDQAVQPASFESDDNTPVTAGSAVVPVTDLEMFVGHIPDRIANSWRREIEPTLLTGCATAGCHGSGSKTMPLLSLGGGLPTPARMSQQNLYRTAEFLLHQPNSISRSLTAAANAHGGGKSSPLKMDGPEMLALESWIREFSSEVPNKAVRLATQPNGNQTVARIGPRPETFEPYQKPPQPLIGNQADAKPIPMLPSDLPSIPDLNAVSQSFVPRDEFDPELFNRFLKDSSSESSRAARALGFPDLQELIGKTKSPEK